MKDENIPVIFAALSFLRGRRGKKKNTRLGELGQVGDGCDVNRRPSTVSHSQGKNTDVHSQHVRDNRKTANARNAHVQTRSPEGRADVMELILWGLILGVYLSDERVKLP